MILKNYKFRDINNLLTQYGFKKDFKTKCYLENHLNTYMKINLFD